MEVKKQEKVDRGATRNFEGQGSKGNIKAPSGRFWSFQVQ